LFGRREADAVIKDDRAVGLHRRLQSALHQDDLFTVECGVNQIQINGFYGFDVLGMQWHHELHRSIGLDVGADDLYGRIASAMGRWCSGQVRQSDGRRSGHVLQSVDQMIFSNGFVLKST
jgi:hypothetical protein